MSSSSYNIPETPPRSHRKHKRNTSIPYATPKTPFSRHQDISLDYRISSKTNLLKTPSSTSTRPFTVYQTPITPKSSTRKSVKDGIIVTPPSLLHHTSTEQPAQFNGRLLFPANPSRIGSGRSHHKQIMKAPSLTTLLTMAAVNSSGEEQDYSDKESEPKTPRKQTFQYPRSSPPKLPHKSKNDREEEDITSTSKSSRNPFINSKPEIKKELIYVDKYGHKKIEKLSDEEASLLQKTKRKLKFE